MNLYHCMHPSWFGGHGNRRVTFDSTVFYSPAGARARLRSGGGRLGSMLGRFGSGSLPPLLERCARVRWSGGDQVNVCIIGKSHAICLGVFHVTEIALLWRENTTFFFFLLTKLTNSIAVVPRWTKSPVRSLVPGSAFGSE